MATVHSQPAPAIVQPHASAGNGDNKTANSQALVSIPPQEQQESEPIAFSPPVARLPVELDVSVPVREFRVRNLLALEPGQLIESRWGNGEDVPLASGDVQLAWSEFEVIDMLLAVRITRLA
jgi:flagellar motor switch/type III secretory pathway protein FliN